MRSRFKVLGHPAHPILVVFPLALYPAAGIADIAWLIFGSAFLWQMAFWLLIGGLVMQLVASLPGLIDWLNIPSDAPAKSKANFHLIVANFVGFLAFVSIVLRDPLNLAMPAPGAIELPRDLSFIVAIAVNLVNGFMLVIFQGWLGAELVYRHGIAVERSDQIDPIVTTPGAERIGDNA